MLHHTFLLLYSLLYRSVTSHLCGYIMIAVLYNTYLSPYNLLYNTNTSREFSRLAGGESRQRRGGPLGLGGPLLQSQVTAPAAAGA